MLWLKLGIGLFIIMVCFLVVLYLSKIRIDLIVNLKGADIKVQAKIYLWRLKVFTINIPKVKLESDPLELVMKQQNTIQKEQSMSIESEDAETMFKQFKTLWQLVKQRTQLKNLIHLDNLVWETGIGCEQADWTALTVGFLWTFKTLSLRSLQKVLILDTSSINIIPFFNSWHFESLFSCMISFKLGKAIRQALWLRKQLKKRRLLHGGPSHSRTHEDSA